MLTEAQKRAKKKYQSKIEEYGVLIRLNKNNIPKEQFEKCKEDLRQMGTTFNKEVIKQLQWHIKQRGL